jgi:hypothetical protein
MCSFMMGCACAVPIRRWRSIDLSCVHTTAFLNIAEFHCSIQDKEPC